MLGLVSLFLNGCVDNPTATPQPLYLQRDVIQSQAICIDVPIFSPKTKIHAPM
jgi:hypothetical protein